MAFSQARFYRIGLCLLGLRIALADIPVHCLRTQIEGHWKFHLGALSDERSTCGHRSPDVETAQPPVEKTVGNVSRIVVLELLAPNKARVEGADGNWTMIYDEGFTVETEGERFFAFSKFLLSEPSSKDSKFPTMIHGKKVFRSVCGKTEVGWYHDKKNQKWGCYYGVKQVKDPEKFTDHLSFLAIPSMPSMPAPLERNDLEGFAADINSRDLGWTATVYDRFIGKTIEEVNRRAGRPKYSFVEASVQAQRAKKVIRHQSFLTMGSSYEEPAKKAVVEKKAAPPLTQAHPSHLPEHFTWRNVSGLNYLDPPMDQQDCGSCYAVSGVRMLSSRYRVHKQNTKLPAFSIDLPLYCAELNQGCNGGYPSLVSLWSSDVGLVPDRCAGPYFGSDTQSCGDMLGHRPHFLECVKKHQAARVTSWSYVGGFYGGCSEDAMLEELHSGGPLVISLEPASDFMFYQKGIYRHAPLRSEVPWVKVDHAVLLVGYGVETKGGKNQKYWILQNSWGRDWGEGGYMRIARGEDESGIEFQALSAQLEDLPDAQRDRNMQLVWRQAMQKKAEL